MNEAMLRNLSPKELIRHVRDNHGEPEVWRLCQLAEELLKKEPGYIIEDNRKHRMIVPA